MFSDTGDKSGLGICSKQENELLGQVGSSIEQGEGEMGERLLVCSPENVDR